MSQTLQKSKRYENITRIIQGKPATSVTTLPSIWQTLDVTGDGTNLSDAARRDYVEAAQLFNHHKTPMAYEAMTAIGEDFSVSAYPNFDALADTAETVVAQKTAVVLKDLFAEFGYDVPASFYNALLEVAESEKWMDMFKNKDQLMQDRLWDAVMHATLLVTPLGLYVHSVFSQHGLRFTHLMNCSCTVAETTDSAFTVTLDQELKPAYLQNMVAASFEQYGVNASTSKDARGF